MTEDQLLITAEESGERIDALLARTIEGLSRSQAQRLLENGDVLLGETTVKKNYKCCSGDRFTVFLPPAEEPPLLAQDLSLSIVWEDADLIVVDKPRGMVVHPAPGHPDGTLVNALLYHCGESLSGIGGERRPGVVHRIDKDTSGLLVAAKHDFAHQALSAELAVRSLSRLYQAVARGGFREDRGTINRPIGRHPTDRKRMAISEKNGRPAVTHWEVLARYAGYTHLRCQLETGRTHQIRVHLASIGHPLLGDFTYGAPSPEKGLEGQCLHAYELKLMHPRSGEPMCCNAPLPDYFPEVLSRLGPVIG